jgi:hypothetical protein
MIRFLLLFGIEWTDRHQGAVVIAIFVLAVVGRLILNAI